MENLRFDQVYEQLKAQYKNIFTYTSYDFPIIYKPLTRAQYYELFENEKLLDIEREDIVCFNCILYPENIDLASMPTGVVSDIAQKILDASFMTKKGRTLLFNSAMEKMNNVDYQISCVIHEAFPEYDIEDIDNWDMIRTMDFLMRSNWVLTMLHGKPGIDLQEILDRLGDDVSFKQDDPRLFNEEKEFFNKIRSQNSKSTVDENSINNAPKKKVSRRRNKGLSEAELATMFPEVNINQGDETSFKEMALGSKNPNDMTPKELAELRNNFQ